MRQAFVDSSFYYSLAVQHDPDHDAVLEVVKRPDLTVCTSRYVLAETMILLTKRTSKKTALRIGNDVILSAETCLLDVTGRDFADAWALFARYPDWDFDLVDAISFALMKREGIETALILDRHFAQMGFSALPG